MPCFSCGGEPGREEIRNVVLVSIDDLGANHTGAYGYARDTTPTLDGLAAGGTLFENTFVQQTWTLTSHLSLFTGVYPQVHGASKIRPASMAIPTLSEILKRNGFATAGFTGIGGFIGPQFGMGRGFDRYETGEGDAAKDNVPRLAWLDEQGRLSRKDPDHRFFLFAHFFDVHSDEGTQLPYHAPAPYGLMFFPEGLAWRHRGDTALLSWFQKTGNYTAYDQDVLRSLYDGGVRYADEMGIKPLIDKLHALGLDKRTLVVITADHGEEFFEHGAPTHQQPYEETARVPLVFSGPGIPRGLRIPDVVELVDVMPTILSLLAIPVPDHVQGRDMTPLLAGVPLAPKAAHVDGILKDWWTSKSHLVALRDKKRWSYVTTVLHRARAATDIGASKTGAEGGGLVFEISPPEELYLRDDDPHQMNNVVAEYPGVAASLREELLAWYAQNAALAAALGGAGGEKKLLTDEEEERMRGLGYVQ